MDGLGHSIYAASLWTDQQAVEHALGANRPRGEPLFSLQGATYLLGGTNPWPAVDGESVHTFLTNRVLKRERGRGVAYLDWTESDPSGPLSVFISVQPQLAADVVYTDPTTGGGVALSGAISRGNTVAVDLIGDHRCVSDSFRVGDPEQFRIDRLVTEGEPIEVLATVSIIDGKNPSGANKWDGVGLIRGWTDSQQDNFNLCTGALTAQAKEDARHMPVFQLFRFNSGWDGRLADGDGGASVDFHRADYRCDYQGNVITPFDANGSKDPMVLNDPEATGWLSPLLIEVMGDTPLIEGYDYSQSTPQRYDQSTIKAEIDRQPRRHMMGFVRVAANRYVAFDDPYTPLSASVYIDGKDVWIRHSGDESNGTRFFAAPTSSSLNSSGAYDYSSIVLTVGLKLPSRVRMASGDPNGRRKGRIYHPGASLWLASPGAIWSVDTSTTSSGGYAGRRGACGATITKPSGGGTSSKPGILRDDRSGLAMIHNLAWAWYRPDIARNTAQWALRDCGFLPSYQAYAGTSIPSNGGSLTTVAYATIGQVVQTINANGQTTTLNTPVTRVHYNNENGVTTWSTEWSELQYVQR